MISVTGSPWNPPEAPLFPAPKDELYYLAEEWKRGARLPIHVDALRCIGCGLCELGCSYRREGVFTAMRSSIMLHLDDKRNYFGVMIKLPNDDLVLGRPEGLEVQQAGKSSGDGGGAKPILLREACDECAGDRPYCVAICPSECLSQR